MKQNRRKSGASRKAVDDHLKRILERMQSALQLGMDTIDGSKKWSNSDPGVQLQAVRYISEFVNSLPSNAVYISSLKIPIAETVVALEGLLCSANEQVYRKAADVSASLTAAIGAPLLEVGGRCLVLPLASLICCGRAFVVASAANALRRILEKLKPKDIQIHGSDDILWNALDNIHVLDKIVEILEQGINNLEASGTMCTALADLLAVMLERWPAQRFSVGDRAMFREMLILQCGTQPLHGLLRILAILAACNGVGVLLLQNASVLSVIANNTSPDMLSGVRAEALHLAYRLANCPSFGDAIKGHELITIAEGCVNALVGPCSVSIEEWSSENEILSLEAARATSMLLSWPGHHHMHFVNAGLLDVLVRLLVADVSITGSLESHDVSYEDMGAGHHTKNVWTSSNFRALLWQIVGWLGAHCQRELAKSIFESPKDAHAFKKLIACACALEIKAMHGKGRSYKMEFGISNLAETHKILQELDPTVNEIEVICKTVLLLISSPCHLCSSVTTTHLDMHVMQYGYAWLPILIERIAAGYSEVSKVKSDKLEILSWLWTITCLLYLPTCKDGLSQMSTLDVLIKVVTEHYDIASRPRETKPSWIAGSFLAGGGSRLVRTCCLQGNRSWAGADDVLFAALWAFAKSSQGSKWAEKFLSTFPKDLLYDEKLILDDTFISNLWNIAGDKGVGAGARWLASCSLSHVGVFGFPSILGKCMRKAFDNPSLADLQLLLGDHGSIYAHQCVIAARCPSLLPESLQRHSRTNLEKEMIQEGKSQSAELNIANKRPPAVVHLNARLLVAAVRVVLEYIYTGIVVLDHESILETRKLAKRCNLPSLLCLLKGSFPGWGTPAADFDLSPIINADNNKFFDVVLQVNEPASMIHDCIVCGMVNDHFHAHQVVLSSRCEYFEALFRSGLRESYGGPIQVPKEWQVVNRFIHFLYFGELKMPTDPNSDCAWNNMDTELQIHIMKGLVDLADLGEQWLQEDLKRECHDVILYRLQQNLHLCPSVITSALSCQQWNIVEAAAKCMAPAYLKMRGTGMLDSLDDTCMEIIREAYVKHSLNDRVL